MRINTNTLCQCGCSRVKSNQEGAICEHMKTTGSKISKFTRFRTDDWPQQRETLPMRPMILWHKAVVERLTTESFQLWKQQRSPNEHAVTQGTKSPKSGVRIEMNQIKPKNCQQYKSLKVIEKRGQPVQQLRRYLVEKY